MTPARWQQIEQLFHEARERAPDDPRAFLDAAVDGDSHLRRQVASLLEQSDGSWLRDAAGHGTEPRPVD